MNVQEPNQISDQRWQNCQQGQQKVSSNPKPFLSRYNSKITPIGFQFHQVEVPEFVNNGMNLNMRRCNFQFIQNNWQREMMKGNLVLHFQSVKSRRKKLMITWLLLKDIFRTRLLIIFLKVNLFQRRFDKLFFFMPPASNYSVSNTFTDYFNALFVFFLGHIVGSVSKERIKGKALDFLHKMEYNYTKAKFYILFPCYLKYNKYRCHQPLQISNEQMERKIADHIQGLKSTKEKDIEKWIKNIEEHLEARVSFYKISQIIEIGKQQKYQVPEAIKQQLQKAQKAGRELRKFISNTRYSIDILRERRQQIKECRIIAPEMVSFEDTVNRCQEWIKKQQNFESKYYDEVGNTFVLKPHVEKIQYRSIHHLVNEYSNIPVSYKNYESTTLKLFNSTKQLLDRMPSFKVAAKTRTARQQIMNKISHKTMRQFLKEIDAHPVCHEQFSNFQVNMRESLELLERITMYLEDTQSEKSIKILNNYLKLINDIPIENKLEKRLQERVQYNQIVEKIKKQLANPGRVDSIKEAFNKLKQKGYKEIADSSYQEKIALYLGWYESQQKLKEQKVVPLNIDILKKEWQIKKKLVNADEFISQFEEAKNQLNIGEESLEQNQRRIKKYHERKQQIRGILEVSHPNLFDMINVLKICISDGLNFQQFEQLYEQIIKFFVLMAKMHFLLKIKSENIANMKEEFFFTDVQCDEIIGFMVHQNEFKDLKSKEGAKAIMEEVNSSAFPKELIEWRRFEQFMREGQEWSEETMQKIKEFREQGTSLNVKQLEQSKYYLHSKAIKEEINRIELIIKWREKITRKLEEEKEQIFDEKDQQFIIKLEKELIILENTFLSSDNMEIRALEFSKQYSSSMAVLLEKISNCHIDNFCKLSEMNKFYREIEKEIERHKFDDKVINHQKDKFREEIILSDDWKQRYTVIKRFQKKKIKKDDEGKVDHKGQWVEENKQEDLANREGLFNPSFEPGEGLENSKKKYSIKNGQFCWYFKFFLMTFEFYKGYKLKFCLEELQKLKYSLTEAWKYIQHYRALYQKSQPTDVQIYNLQSQGVKIPFFLRQYWILKKHWSYIHAWKIMADSILESVPIIGMELKATKTQDLLNVLANKKQETEEAQKAKKEENNVEPVNMKRQRKPNKLYNNEDITLLTEQNAGPKIKKKRKGCNQDGQYRNTAVASQAKKNPTNTLEEIQRTEAILKYEISSNIFALEDPKEYCICRYGQPNENTTMLLCEEKNCEEWFHIECIGIKKHQVKQDLLYKCVGCNSLKGEKSLGNFYWDTHSKITQYAFEEIVNEGKNLGVHTQQLKKICTIQERMIQWKEAATKIIDKVMHDSLTNTDIKVFEKNLYDLYLQSLWLPTFHPEGETLKLLVQICREQV